MKEKKKSVSRVIVRAALILLLLTLISGCFLGSTFARYVSKGDGSFNAGIAKWEITGTTSETGSFITGLDKFTPNMAGYDLTNSTKRSRSVEVTLFTIKNEGEVDAYVSFDLQTSGEGNTIKLFKEQDPDTVGEEWALPDTTIESDGSELQYAPTKTEVKEIFTLTVGSEDVTVKANDNGNETVLYPVAEDGTEYAGMYLVPAGQTMTVKGTVTWVTDLGTDSTGNIDGFGDSYIVEGDLRDTWIGQNVFAIGWDYSWYALQASELPESQP